MPYSISGIQGAWSHTFGFSGAITPENPNIYSIRSASSGCKADSRAVRGFPSAAAGYSTTLRASALLTRRQAERAFGLITAIPKAIRLSLRRGQDDDCGAAAGRK